ncbi:MAG: protein phosphatase 2C domain-containing protein [Scytonema sp. PMC 1069.18]|nr:protein phosphatase 2C domain-containing protein [Scytonema sp. PMC 1069.18]MEC4885879.1 protein phosphatase 2C domain-containing protein [Scytonema sp. PMC 1070.18]
MENDAATLYCPNEFCQAPNPLTHKFCQRCSTPIPKRYLWAVADGVSLAAPGELLADRYLVISNSLLLDIKPGFLPETPEVDNLQLIRPYLRLFPYRLHVPQVYGIVSVNLGETNREILLLEKPPLEPTEDGTAVQLAQKFSNAWRSATSMRQLNWLWQIANLWQPLLSEGVASSLLNPELIRVEGSLIHLLELHDDKNTEPSLSQLGRFWQSLCGDAKPAIVELLNEICRSLESGAMVSGEQVVAVLDKALAALGRDQTPTIKIATKSDTGPSRQRNEDACYPPSGSTISKPPQNSALAIVCDGIGGHEGGNVASNLAIETIQQQLQELTSIPADHIDPGTLLVDLERAAAVANDKISQRNDEEHRHGRQRMGTTLVMALPICYQMYIAHVGDSRAYWITRYGCYQVTLDDDVASREVRLGYATYRDAIQQGASGSLVQALGMGSSNSLHPTSQRFILDEDCIFLLCSDGLSDFDRVEQYWDSEILPLLNGKSDISNVTDTLVSIANNQNGHDNVTIALVHCLVNYSEPKASLQSTIADTATVSTYSPSAATLPPTPTSQHQKTQVISSEKQIRDLRLPLHLIILFLLILGGCVVGYLWQMGLLPLLPPLNGSSPVTSPQDNSPAAPLQANPSPDNAPTGESVIVTTSQISLNTTSPSVNTVIVPTGSVLQVTNIPNSQTAPTPQNQDPWVDLRVCSLGKTTQPTSQPTATDNQPIVKQGQNVRIPFSKFNSLQRANAQPSQVSLCKQVQDNAPPVEEAPVQSVPRVPPSS